MPSIQINIRLKPSQVYEIKKIADHFDTTMSIVIRNAIDDYINIYKTWRYRIDSNKLSTSDNMKITYTPKISEDSASITGLCFHPNSEEIEK